MICGVLNVLAFFTGKSEHSKCMYSTNTVHVAFSQMDTYADKEWTTRSLSLELLVTQWFSCGLLDFETNIVVKYIPILLITVFGTMWDCRYSVPQLLSFTFGQTMPLIVCGWIVMEKKLGPPYKWRRKK